MDDYHLETKIKQLVQSERKITTEILHLLNLAQERKFFLRQAYSSLFDWMTRGLGYSESAAYRRIEAARLLRAVPTAAEKLRSGEINITTMAAAQSVMRAQEKATKTKVTSAEKAQVVESILMKSRPEVSKTLLERFPEAALTVNRERKVAVNSEITRLAVNLPDKVLKDLDRIKEVLSHAMPEATYSDIIARIAKEFLDRKDPIRKQAEKFARQSVNH